MGNYSEIIQQLVGAAYDRGLFSESQIFALADGAIGLKEALEKAFPKLQFILDRPHLKEHLYAGVEAMELPQKIKMSINDALISLIDVGKVRKVIKKLQNYQGVGAKKIETLANYLIRFRSLCSLSSCCSVTRFTNQFTKGVRSTSGISIGRGKSFILLLKQMHSF